MRSIYFIIVTLLLVVAGCTQTQTTTQELPEDDRPRVDNSLKNAPADAVEKVQQEPLEETPADSQADTTPKELAAIISETDNKELIAQESPTTTQVVEYQIYSEEAFDAARAEGKVIFLDFYADWCKYCKAQHPEIEIAFNQITDQRIAGFQVDYDNQKDMKKTYGISRQNTKVFLDTSGEVQLKTIEHLPAQKILEELEKLKQ